MKKFLPTLAAMCLMLSMSLVAAAEEISVGLQHVRLLTTESPARWEVRSTGPDAQLLAYGESYLGQSELSPEFLWLLAEYDALCAQPADASSQLRTRRRAQYQDIATLLTCHWAQGDPFNRLCPTFGGSTSHTKTGCVATAMAQVLYYHKLPTRLHGKIDYTYQSDEGLKGSDGTTNIRITDDLSRYTIDWANLIDSPWNRYTGTASCTAVEGNAVATLMYVCGLATKMHYGYKGSGAHVDWATEGINTLFDGLRAEHVNFSEDVILSELRAGRPVIYSGGGHCFVIDGATAAGYLHCNLGWGGGGEVDEDGRVGNPDGYYLPTVMAGYTSGKSIVRVWPDGTQTPWTPGTGGGGAGVTGVGLNLESATLEVGQTAQLTAYVLPVTLTGNYSYTYTSSNASVASVSASGLITAHAVGTATITVALSTNSFIKTTCDVVVRQTPKPSLEGKTIGSFADIESGANYVIVNPASDAFLVTANSASQTPTLRSLSPGVSTSYSEYYQAASPSNLGCFWTITKVDEANANDHRYYFLNKGTGTYLYFDGNGYSLHAEMTPLYMESKANSCFTLNWGQGLSNSGYRDYLTMDVNCENPASKGGSSAGNNRLWQLRLIAELPTGVAPATIAEPTAGSATATSLSGLPARMVGGTLPRGVYIVGGRKVIR